MKYIVTSLLLFVLLATSCNNQPQNTQNDIATPVSVTELKKGSISRIWSIRPGQHSLPME